MDTLEILRETELFNNLDDAELEAVEKCIRHVTLQPEEVVISEGTPGEALYIVREGKVLVEKDSEGNSLTLAEIGPGQAFGEMSLIDSFPTSASVRAVEESELLAIGQLNLNVLLSWNPILAAKMWRSFTEMLSTRLRDMNERMASQG